MAENPGDNDRSPYCFLICLRSLRFHSADFVLLQSRSSSRRKRGGIFYLPIVQVLRALLLHYFCTGNVWHEVYNKLNFFILRLMRL